jgi:hypothetical protein
MASCVARISDKTFKTRKGLPCAAQTSNDEGEEMESSEDEDSEEEQEEVVHAQQPKRTSPDCEAFHQSSHR